MWRAFRIVAWAIVGGATAAAACEQTAETTPDGGGAQGVGGCPSAPVPLFAVRITAADGRVPPDTTLLVRWSAAEEPTVDLREPDSWPSVEEGANVDCDIPDGATPPLELDTLRCELWTSGPTYVEIAAEGYRTVEQTLTPPDGDCDPPATSEVELELVRDVDAG